MAKPRRLRDLIADYRADASKWKVIRTETVPSKNVRNQGGLSIQELLERVETGERMVRHTLLKPDGSVFQPSHFRPYWKS